MTRDSDGIALEIGQRVGFKRGFEQYGEVVAVRPGGVTVAIYDADTGETTEKLIEARLCWQD